MLHLSRCARISDFGKLILHFQETENCNRTKSRQSIVRCSVNASSKFYQRIVIITEATLNYVNELYLDGERCDSRFVGNVKREKYNNSSWIYNLERCIFRVSEIEREKHVSLYFIKKEKSKCFNIVRLCSLGNFQSIFCLPCILQLDKLFKYTYANFEENRRNDSRCLMFSIFANVILGKACLCSQSFQLNSDLDDLI